MAASAFSVGDRVRLIASTCAAQEDEEGNVFRIEWDQDGKAVALDIPIDGDSERTREQRFLLARLSLLHQIREMI